MRRGGNACGTGTGSGRHIRNSLHHLIIEKTPKLGVSTDCDVIDDSGFFYLFVAQRGQIVTFLQNVPKLPHPFTIIPESHKKVAVLSILLDKNRLFL